MSAQQLQISVLVYPETPSILYPPKRSNETFSLDLQSAGIVTLHDANQPRGDQIRGYLHFPDVSTSDECRALSVPSNRSTTDDLDRSNGVVGISPWLPKCNRRLLNAAQGLPVTQAFIFYPRNQSSLPAVDDPYWRATELENYSFPIYAVGGGDGEAIMNGYLDWVNRSVEDTTGNVQRARLFADIDTGAAPQLPGLWMFLLIVLGVLLVVVGLTSLSMHVLQYQRRTALRRRVVNGEVDLEALGIKRLVVPQKVLENIPLRTYVSSPPSPPEGKLESSVDNPDLPPPPRILAAPSPPLPPSPTVPALPPAASKAYDQPSCSICLDEFVHNVTTVRELRCRHIFHPGCIDAYLEKQSSLCPMCKKTALPAGYVPPSITNTMVRREREMRRVAEGRATSHRWWEIEFWVLRRSRTHGDVEMAQSGGTSAGEDRRRSGNGRVVRDRRRSRSGGEVGHDDGEAYEIGRSRWRRGLDVVFPGFR